MLLDRLQVFALSLPHVTVVAQWGGLVYKFAGKVFLVLSLDGSVLEGVTFKVAPEEFDELTAIDGIGQARISPSACGCASAISPRSPSRSSKIASAAATPSSPPACRKRRVPRSG